MTVPQAVESIVRKWQENGSPQQQAFGWSLDKWQAKFPDYAGALSKLPPAVDRDVILEACKDAASSPDSAIEAFLVAMAWGYGGVGYGPWRTKRILDGDAEAGQKLQAVAEAVATDGSVAGYQLMANASRLKHLGPAFGTKFLYFCPQAHTGPRALILDQIVGSWLDSEADLDLDFETWDTGDYETYVQTVENWAGELGVQATDIEECIFTNGWQGPEYLLR